VGAGLQNSNFAHVLYNLSCPRHFENAHTIHCMPESLSPFPSFFFGSLALYLDIYLQWSSHPTILFRWLSPVRTLLIHPLRVGHYSLWLMSCTSPTFPSLGHTSPRINFRCRYRNRFQPRWRPSRHHLPKPRRCPCCYQVAVCAVASRRP